MTNDALKALEDIFFENHGNKEYWLPETVKQYETIHAALAPVDVQKCLDEFPANNNELKSQRDVYIWFQIHENTIKKVLTAQGLRGVPEEYALVPVSVIKFLNGEDKLEGCSFGERPLGATGMYWWRKYLKPAPKKEGV